MAKWHLSSADFSPVIGVLMEYVLMQVKTQSEEHLLITNKLLQICVGLTLT